MKKVILILAAFGLITSYSNAQVDSMAFSQSSGYYAEITGDSIVGIATGTSGAASLDDVIFPNISLSFPFAFNGSPYSKYTVSSNGFITFGNTLPAGNNYLPISSTVGYNGAVSAVGTNMLGVYCVTANTNYMSTTLTAVSGFAGVMTGKIITGVGIPAGTTIVSFNTTAGTIQLSNFPTMVTTGSLYTIASGSIVRGTTGTAGNRVHTIQWKNFRSFPATGASDNFNFQIKIYETSNKIEMVYGSIIHTTTAINCQVGLRGAFNSSFNNRTTTTNWLTTTRGTLNTATCQISITVIPNWGTTFMYGVPVIHDVGTVSIDSPQGGFPGLKCCANYTAKATFKNHGNASETFAVYFGIIDAGGTVQFLDNETVTQLAPNATIQKEFGGLFSPPKGGVYECYAFTDLDNDQFEGNNEIIKNLTVIKPEGITMTFQILDKKGKKDTTSGKEKFTVSACGDQKVINFPSGLDHDDVAEKIRTELNVSGSKFTASGAGSTVVVNHDRATPKIETFKFKKVQGRSTTSSESAVYLITKYLIKISGTAAGGGAIYVSNGDISVFTNTTSGQSSMEVAESLLDSLSRKTPDGDTTYSFGLFRNVDSTGGLTNDTVDLGFWQLGTRDLSQTTFQSTDPGISIVKGPVIMSLNLGVCIEGLYNNVTNKIVNDTVTVLLRNASSPYSIVDTSISTFDSGGMQTFYFFNTQNNVPYYIQVNHRNSIETWSSNPTSFANSTRTYDFRSDPVWAYGNNMKRLDTSPLTYGFYTGDVNQNGSINLDDIIAVYNNASNFVNGYVNTDVTGDNRTDLSDILITYNNSVNFVEKITP